MKVSAAPKWGASALAATNGVRQTLWFVAGRLASAQEPVFVAPEAQHEDLGPDR